MKHLKDKTILLAEDKEADVLLMQRIFKRFGLAESLRIVRNGHEAIEYLDGTGPYSDRQQHPFPSLLILDLEMPKKSGRDVMQWIRTHPELESLLVVIFTDGIRAPETSKMFEDHANTCIFNSHFMKPANDANVEMLLSLYDSWSRTRQWKERASLSQR